MKLLDRVLKEYINAKYVNSYLLVASKTNGETFSELRGCLKGKDVVMCGAGPSLSNYKIIDNCVHVALNRALLNEKVHYDIFIADDWDGIDFFKEELERYDCKKYFGHQIGDYTREIPADFGEKCGAKRYYTDSFIVGSGYLSKFVADIDKMPIGNMPNIALSAMQILLFMQPRKIYLVGCDASAGHYTQKGLNLERIKRHEKDIKKAVSNVKVIEKWKELREFAKCFYGDTEIISINPVGLKGIFKDEYQQ